MNLDAETESLVERAATGDAAAVDELLGLHRLRLRTMVAVRIDSRLLSRVDPSDIVQDALVTAHQRLPRYLKDRAIPFYPWLRQIALGKLIDNHRRHMLAGRRDVRQTAKWNPSLSDQSAILLADRLHSSITSPSQRAIRDETKRRVKEALTNMSDTDREIIILRHLEDLSVKEIAAVLAIAEGTVKSRHYRALERLRKQIDE